MNPDTDNPCRCCRSVDSNTQRVFVGNDTRLVQIDPKEAAERSKFGAALATSQQNGHSVSAGGNQKAWSARHMAVATKLPMTTGMVKSISAETKRTVHAGRPVARTK